MAKMDSRLHGNDNNKENPMNKEKHLFGGIEAGGTKFVCAVGSGPDNILAKEHFPTTTPQETLGKCIDFFHKIGEKYLLKAIGIASFGPLDLDKKSAAYGSITTTPKPGWANTNLAKTIGEGLNIPVVLDTDVNGAALGEWRWGAAQGLDTFIYLTIGTGIGGGGMVNSKLMHGLSHPEMGHILIPHDLKKDPFPGVCPSTPIVLKGWPAAPLSLKGGVKRLICCRRAMKPGNWKLITSPTAS